MKYRNTYYEWLDSEFIDEESKKELNALIDEDEIENRFYKDLEFGTAGLRGLMGIGSNRMNVYTVKKATLGLGNYLNKIYDNPSVVIAYDTRFNSREFAKVTALVLNNIGIKTYIFKEETGTPILAYAINNLKASCGIVITSSHNPKEYNGYKVYLDDGGQIVFPHDDLIMDEIKEINVLSDIKMMDEQSSKIKGLYNTVPEGVTNMFINETSAITLKNIDLDAKKDVNILYTSLHGTGIHTMKQIFKIAGYTNFNTVKKQENFDPNFTTAPYPNPEEIDTFKYALDVAKTENPDIILATDPDSDRLGIMTKNSKGEYELLSGNIVGAIFAEYILSNNFNYTNRDFVVKSIVSTRLINQICDEYDVNCMNVLTGCKWIADKIENNYTGGNFIFGFEESIGYMVDPYVRDKNGFSAAVLIAEIVTDLKLNNKTLYDYIEEIYEKYGYFYEKTHSIYFKGVTGIDKINSIMDSVANNKIKKFKRFVIESISNYNTKTNISLRSKRIKDLDIPSSNVIEFNFTNGSWFIIRPSGTEPKIKLYFGVNGKNMKQCLKEYETLRNAVFKTLNI
ncbi:MAG: phospho-sugar mutase [Bacilli bacterium]